MRFWNNHHESEKADFWRDKQFKDAKASHNDIIAKMQQAGIKLKKSTDIFTEEEEAAIFSSPILDENTPKGSLYCIYCNIGRQDGFRIERHYNLN